MRYAQIREMDISNGKGIGVSLFVQGCPFHCKNCFNSETWDFNGGKEWNRGLTNKFLELVGKPHITRVSFLGGEPLANENVIGIHKLINEIRFLYPDKKIWLWTGYTVEEIYKQEFSDYSRTRMAVIEEVDYLVDGRFVYELRDLTLAFRGSSNQRILKHKDIIDLKEKLNVKN